MEIKDIIVESVDNSMVQEPPRPHLGISMIGHKCDRWLWLSFRWAVVEHFSGRMLRLFRRGQLEERTAVEDLRRAGYEVRNCLDDQQYISFGSHVGGSPDGEIKGLPQAPKKWHLLEFKTHNKRSFDKLEKEGVALAKPMHYTQMQCYMYGRGLDRALYYAVCKDDDRIYTERVNGDTNFARRAIERGKRIALSDRMPEPMSTNPTWYECKMCPAHDLCFGSRLTREVNCRTCAHVTPREDGTWYCERHSKTLSVDCQRTGCRDHVLHPDLVPWELEPVDEYNCMYNGVVNGGAGKSSKEIINEANK